MKVSVAHGYVAGMHPGTLTCVASLTEASRDVILATATLNDQLFVTRRDAARVSVYNTTSFQLLRRLAFSGLSYELGGLATSAVNNHLYISDFGNNKVYQVDLSETNTVSAMTLISVSRPRALSVTVTGNVLVTDNYGIVYEIAPGGSIVRQTNVGPSTNYHAVDVGNGMLVVSQHDPIGNIIKMFTNGTILKSYGPETAGSGLTGSMTDPRTLALDTLGYILVADYGSSRILVVNPSLTEARLLQLPADTSLSSPRALSLDSLRGRLYIGEDGGLNRLLVCDGVTDLYSFFD
jgi:hypothetical protein